MSRTLNFARRNFKELIRDPLSLIFEIALPIFLLFIFQQIKVPGEAYKIENFTPGIIIFGFSFITLFTGALIAKDRGTSLLIRLGVSPMKPMNYILGYIISLLPIVLIQNILFYAAAIAMGLTFSINIIYTILVGLVISIMFISFGILIGSLVSEKASGGVGSVIVQLVCFTSGMYFSKDLVGAGFAKVCEILPFESALTILRAVMNNDFSMIEARNVITLAIYMVAIVIISIIVFRKKMTSDNK